MEDWYALAGIVVAVAAVAGFLWKVWKEVREVQDGLAWVNKDVAEVKKDVEWLVWHFKKGS